MPRIDRNRLREVRFPFSVEIATRIDDVDVQGHVNNAAVAVILQEARARFNAYAGLPELLGDLRLLVAGIMIEYAAEMHYPEPVEVFMGIIASGRSSIILGQVIRQSGSDRVYAETAVVISDIAGPAAIPTRLRESFEGLRLVPAS